MPLNNLTSMTALCRNYSTGSRHNSYSSRSINVIKGATRLLTRASGLTLGAGLGHLILGDIIPSLEEDRQKQFRYFFWWSTVKTEDLTEKMWPELKELREKPWFQDMERRWSGLKDKMFSDRKS